MQLKNKGKLKLSSGFPNLFQLPKWANEVAIEDLLQYKVEYLM
jgi:hypothetical protein